MPTRTKKKIYLEYRYGKEEAWKVYDWTQIPARAAALYGDMQREYPGAEYRRSTK